MILFQSISKNKTARSINSKCIPNAPKPNTDSPSNTRKKKNKRRANRDSSNNNPDDSATESSHLRQPDHQDLNKESDDVSPGPSPRPLPTRGLPALSSSTSDPHTMHTNFNTTQFGGLGGGDGLSYNRPASIEVTRGAPRPLPKSRGI